MNLKEKLLNTFRKNDKVKELVEERRIERLATQREKNSNERELERLMEEERQKNIKLQLDHYRKKRHKEINKTFLMNKSKDVISQKPIFNSKAVILKEKRSFLRWKEKKKHILRKILLIEK